MSDTETLETEDQETSSDIESEQPLIEYKGEEYSREDLEKLISDYRNDKKWKSLVPNEVVELMKEFNGIERIKSFYGK